MLELDAWLSADIKDPEQWLSDGLTLGCKQLAMSTGIISLVNGEEYLIHQVYSTLGDVFKPGMLFALSDTYCKAVIAGRKTVTYIQVGIIPSMVLHPVYTAMQLESYIGTPLRGPGGQVLGTLNFSSHDAREWEFSDEDVAMVEAMAEKISAYLLEQ